MTADRAAVSAVLTALRARGHRITPQRRTVIEIMLSAPAHLSAEEITERAQATLPIDLSTVYRTLEVLEDAGVVSHAHLGHTGARYHVVLEDHRHFSIVCDVCGRTVEVDPDDLEGAVYPLLQRFGFATLSDHFPVVARCSDCEAPR